MARVESILQDPSSLQIGEQSVVVEILEQMVDGRIANPIAPKTIEEANNWLAEKLGEKPNYQELELLTSALAFRSSCQEEASGGKLYPLNAATSAAILEGVARTLIEEDPAKRLTQLVHLAEELNDMNLWRHPAPHLVKGAQEMAKSLAINTAITMGPYKVSDFPEGFGLFLRRTLLRPTTFAVVDTYYARNVVLAKVDKYDKDFLEDAAASLASARSESGIF